MPALFFPKDAEVVAESARIKEWLVQTQPEAERLWAQHDRARKDLRTVEALCQRLHSVFNSRLQWLRSCQWTQLRAGDFEHFLAQVFEERGFSVQLTGKSGDQGVDLIVTRPDARIAIQAKGYPGSTVGNDAVQQAFAGMTFYRCERCAVITNSTFTRSAYALAESVQCTLIDGSKIDDLIDGRVTV